MDDWTDVVKHRWAVEIDVFGISPDAAANLLTEVEAEEIDGQPAITSVAWDAIDDPQAVHAAAELALERMAIGYAVQSNSSARMGWTGRLWERSDNGERRTHYRALIGNADIFLDPVRSLRPGVRPFGDRVASLLEKYPMIGPALHVFATCGPDVRAMWLAFEVAKQIAGGEKELVELSWTTDEQLDRFMTTANRNHRHYPLKPPRRQLPEPLTPNGCRAYVRGLFERLLDREVPT